MDERRGRPNDPVEPDPADPDRADPDPDPGADWLESHVAAARLRVPGRRLLIVGAVLSVAVAAAVTAFTRDSGWPTHCGVDGHQDWCGAPSRTMTDDSLAEVVHDYCPGLADTESTTVVPQPLSLAELAGPDTMARTTGSQDVGREDSLLGRPTSFAWVTRWVGGRNDGRVDLRCPGATTIVPALRLQSDQFRSTVAASGGSAGGAHLNFAAAAESAIRIVSPQRSVSFGFFTCDTAAIDLEHLQPGASFGCQVEAYWPQGQGLYRVDYRVSRERPYFEVDEG
ncbi:hypothetical protein BH18ACT9_BH18ACT9_00310 [soil metagenome]